MKYKALVNFGSITKGTVFEIVSVGEWVTSGAWFETNAKERYDICLLQFCEKVDAASEKVKEI